MRQFIRHPVDIPIEVVVGDDVHAHPHVYNVSLGGLALQTDMPLQAGAIVVLRIPFVRPAFETKARVVWCSEHGDCFDLGVEFLDPDDAFRARMVEQVCHIEVYKRVMSREGRVLTAQQAAEEWIDRYASGFPGGITV